MRGERAGLRWSSGQTPEGEIRDPKVALIETTNRWAFLQPPSCCLRVRSALLLATHSNPLLPSLPPRPFVEDGFYFNYPPIGRRAVSPRTGRALTRTLPTTDRTSSLSNLTGSRS